MTASLDSSRTAWISQGFERLVDRVRKSPAAVHFDVLIIGSGYGGAIAAATFAGRRHGGTSAPVTVGVLERGNEYLPGAFPTGLGELPRHVRRDRNKEGLFDIRLGPEVVTVVANGLGGGSLINAGVMATPAPGVFATGWPDALSSLPAWQTYFTRARELLGATFGGTPNTILQHAAGPPQKFEAISSIAPPAAFRPAELTVAMSAVTSSGGVNLNPCTRCGDCATGCNFGAKNSLDVNLLVRAHRNGAEIFSGATVLGVEQDGGGNGWIVHAVHTNAKLRARDGEVCKIRASKVVLCAGTLGSSEILLRSRDLGLSVSDGALRTRCSTNGDMLIVDYDTADTVHTVADETVQPSARAIGPTITGIIDLRAEHGVVIEEMSVPAGLRIAFTEIFGTINALHSLAECDASKHKQGFPDHDIYSVSDVRIERSALYAVMGDDGATGAIDLDGLDPSDPSRDGVAVIRWNGLQKLPVFDKQVETLAALTKGSGGRIIPNPVWKLLPEDLNWLLENKLGPLITVHPLGGCAMADSGADGVVDDCGRVFSSSTSDAVHDGLAVLDGSIIPTALGINPALTIAAVALRAAEKLAELWQYIPGNLAGSAPPLDRPVFRATDVAAAPLRTEVEIIERLVGPVKFRPRNGQAESKVVELTLRFKPKALAELAKPPSDGGNPVAQVEADQTMLATRSRIRVFPAAAWETLELTYSPPRLKEQKLDAIAEFSAPLSGSLRIFERRPSRALGRIWRASTAWLLNRGLRDTWQAIVDGDDGPGLLSRIRSGIALASRSGEIRALEYDLTVGTPDPGAKLALDGHRIVGTKRFTYDRRCNPWRQLMEVRLDTFPGLRRAEARRVLQLDPVYLARIGVPLFQITRQRDGASALGELVSFFGYFLRLLLGLHVLSFRAPDKAPVNTAPDLLADTNLPGLPPAETHDVPILPPMAPAGGGVKASGYVRLTRYPRSGTTKRPVVMLHGYSASGTTFAHHAVQPNFASHLWNSGRDVWIADLRTSAGQPATAQMHWSFEQIGTSDVPAVLQKVATVTGQQVDVVAHCMGAVVFSQAVLSGQTGTLVNRAAMTQVGPLVVFSPANIFRTYLLRYLIDFLPDNYSFNPPDPTLADDLWDRLLSTLPYPVEEFDIENPVTPWKRTPWTRIRHRMDALYGRVFNAHNMTEKVLPHIDEHFGTLSLRTAAQTLHFVRASMMTTFQGRNELVSRALLRSHWTFPTFTLHGGDNGLAHPSTADRMWRIFEDAGSCAYQTPFIDPDAGHQDALIGTKRIGIFQEVEKFLDKPFTSGGTGGSSELTAYPPWIGPIITEERPSTNLLVMRLGSMPTHRAPEGVLMLRIALDGDRIVRPDDATLPWDEPYILSHMAVLQSNELAQKGWDAFDVPAISAMPGFDPSDDPGDGLLVLLAYAESPALPAIERLYMYVDVAARMVWSFDPRGARGGIVSARILTYERFSEMARAALRVLEAQPLPAKGGIVRRGAPGTLVLTGSAVGQGPRIAPRLLRPRTGTGTPQTGTGARQTGETFATSTLAFSVTTSSAASAALETLVEQDRDLMDGVVPYDPPDNPPTSPLLGGTSFAFASCQYPAGPLDEPLAYRGYERIVQRLEGTAGIRPRFVVLTGDQVYVDPTAGLYDPKAQDDRYRLPYEQWLRYPSVRGTLRRVPSFMLLDDHEIDDNWQPEAQPDTPSNQQTVKAGIDAYRKYQRGIHHSLTTFTFDGFPFFLLDTRTARDHRKVGTPARPQLFSAATMSALKAWLLASSGPKFVVSPAMLLPRHRRAVQHDTRLDASNLSALHSDGWDGYPDTLREVLGFIADNEIRHVVFLSGDEHRACVATAELRLKAGGPITRIHSIHTAAMYAPYPFANSLAEDLFTDEPPIVFTYASQQYECTVQAAALDVGDGPMFVRVRADAGTWRLDYEYADGMVRTIAI